MRYKENNLAGGQWGCRGGGERKACEGSRARMRSGLNPGRDAVIFSVVMGIPLLDGRIKCYTFLRAIYQHFLQNKRKP